VILQRHPLDLEADSTPMLDLFVEELPEQVQLLSDCLSTGTTFSTKACLSSFSTIGSIISCGKRAQALPGVLP